MEVLPRTSFRILLIYISSQYGHVPKYMIIEQLRSDLMTIGYLDQLTPISTKNSVFATAVSTVQSDDEKISLPKGSMIQTLNEMALLH